MSSLFDLHDYAAARCKDEAIDLHAVMLTNGTLLDADAIEGLKARAVGVMISLDGFAEKSAKQRPFANGRSPVTRVVAGIERMIGRGLRPHISITVTPQNAACVADAVIFALEHDLTFSLNLYRAGTADDAVRALHLAEPELIAGIKAAYAVIAERMPRWSVTGTALDRGQLVSSHQHPCGMGLDYIVIDHRGQISRCQLQMDRTVATVKHPNPLQAVRTHSATGAYNLPANQKEDCHDCIWRDWCAGGCPILTHAATGHYNTRSPYCGVYQAIYPEAIRLEGLRLLKYCEIPQLAN
jgi:uncharacterized protein